MSSSPPVSAVLGASRRHLRGDGLSDTQLIRHSRGAQSLRSTLFDATIPFGFTPLFEPAPPPSRASRPLAPVMIQQASLNGAAEPSGTFVFARQTRTPMQEAVDPSTSVLTAFLPLSIPPHLTPRTPSTSWTSTQSVSPSPSRASSPSRCPESSTSWSETLPPPLPSCYFDPVYHPSEAPSPTPSKKVKKKKKRRTTLREFEDENEEQDQDSFEKFLASACPR